MNAPASTKRSICDDNDIPAYDGSIPAVMQW